MAILVNGTSYAWTDVKMVLFGIPVVGITKIEYNRKMEKTNNYGMGGEPIGRGYGRVEYSGSIELYLEEWSRIINASPNRDPLQISWFDVQVLYASDIHAIVPKVDILHAVEFMEDGLSTSEGETKTLITIPFIYAGLTHE